jgi:chromosomal replication initiation ATPase DnaA
MSPAELLNHAVKRARWARHTPATEDLRADAAELVRKPLLDRIEKLTARIDNLHFQIRIRDNTIRQLTEQIRGLQGEPDAPPPDQLPRRITARMIVDAVCVAFGVSYVDMLSARRGSAIAHPRQVATYLMRRMTSLSLRQIGKQLGGRDHSTVLKGISLVTERRKQDPELDARIKQLEDQLQASVKAEDTVPQLVEVTT